MASSETLRGNIGGHERALLYCSLATALWFLCLSPSGAIGVGTRRSASAGELQFSPDGKTIAYEWTIALIKPVSRMEARAVSQTAEARWCSVAEPDRIHSAKVLQWGENAKGYRIGVYVHIGFSPDSRHLAVATPRKLRIIDLRSEKHWVLNRTGEFVTSLRWIDNEEIGYVTHSNRRGEWDEIVDRAIWRQKITQEWRNRREINKERGIEGYSDSGGPKFTYGAGDFPVESWSPKGRFVVFSSSPMGGMVQLLDTQTGELRSLKKRMRVEYVSWKRDESAFVCVGDSSQALLVNSRTLEIVDFSRQFGGTFGEYAPSIFPEWTPDDRYIVANDLRLGGCLVRPQPWEIRTVGQELGRRLEVPKELLSIWVKPLGISGWLRARAPSQDYALNYDNGTLVALSQMGKFGPDRPVVSPDGTTAASGRHDGRELKIRPIRLATSQPATRSAGSGPAEKRFMAKYVEAKNQFGRKQLYVAVFNGHREKVDFLLAEGADVNGRNEGEETPLHAAAFTDNVELAELLIAKGADVNARDEFGMTPLHHAARQGYKKVAALLIDKRADVNAQAMKGGTPLHKVAEAMSRKSEERDIEMERMKPEFAGDHAGTAALLIEKGAKVNARNEYKETPLHAAAGEGYCDVGEVLISNGADVNAKDRQGDTPLSIAVDRKHEEFAKLLRKHGAGK